MALAADASVGLKWVLQEPDSRLAEALLAAEPDLLLPDFRLGEATNILVAGPPETADARRSPGRPGPAA